MNFFCLCLFEKECIFFSRSFYQTKIRIQPQRKTKPFLYSLVFVEQPWGPGHRWVLRTKAGKTEQGSSGKCSGWVWGRRRRCLNSWNNLHNLTCSEFSKSSHFVLTKSQISQRSPRPCSICSGPLPLWPHSVPHFSALHTSQPASRRAFNALFSLSETLLSEKCSAWLPPSDLYSAVSFSMMFSSYPQHTLLCFTAGRCPKSIRGNCLWEGLH